jgi:membrane associated rhomboid family serine protease
MTTTLVLILITVLISFLCFNSPQLFNMLSLNPYRVVTRGEWWRVVSHGFVHGDTVHLVVNMIVLYSFGRSIELSFNELHAFENLIRNPRAAYLSLYFLGMIAATVHDLVKNRNNPRYTSIGASGAVSAVVFATIFLDPWGKLLLMGVIPIPGILFGILYLGYSQCSARRGKDNVNHYAHLYGALFGFVYPLLLNPQLAHHFLGAFRTFDII